MGLDIRRKMRSPRGKRFMRWVILDVVLLVAVLVFIGVFTASGLAANSADWVVLLIYGLFVFVLFWAFRETGKAYRGETSEPETATPTPRIRQTVGGRRRSKKWKDRKRR